MNMEPYEPNVTVQNDSEIVVKIEIDEYNMFEYPEPLSNELNGEEHSANNEDNIHNSYYKSHQKGKHGRKVLRHDTATCKLNRPQKRKRKKKLSTKMKDFETDYMPYTSRSKRNSQHKTRNAAEIENGTSFEKRGMKRQKCEKRDSAKVPREDLPIRENEAQQSSMEVPQVDIKLPTKKNHICYRCGKQCSDEEHLELHMVEQHPKKKPWNFLKRCTEQSGNKDHTCPFYKRTFRWGSSLKNHLLHHTREKPNIVKFVNEVFHKLPAYDVTCLLMMPMKVVNGSINVPSVRKIFSMEQILKATWSRIYIICVIFGPRQANLVPIAYASSEGSGEPAHPRSLDRTSAARSYKQRVKRNLQTESQIPGPSEWLDMRS